MNANMIAPHCLIDRDRGPLLFRECFVAGQKWFRGTGAGTEQAKCCAGGDRSEGGTGNVWPLTQDGCSDKR